MPRPRMRACLNEGLKLDINRLVRHGFIRVGAFVSGTLTWRNSYTDEETARLFVRAEFLEPSRGEFHLNLGYGPQIVPAISKPRHFGGVQWYFLCPKLPLRCSTLWCPPGAGQFLSRQAWGPRRVCYLSQLETRHDRALRTAQKIRHRLGGDDWVCLDGLDPPKPKWMRWRTYDRILARCHAMEGILDARTNWFIAQLEGEL
jgi:hypothetical protein